MIKDEKREVVPVMRVKIIKALPNLKWWPPIGSIEIWPDARAIAFNRNSREDGRCVEILSSLGPHGADDREYMVAQIIRWRLLAGRLEAQRNDVLKKIRAEELKFR
jgi:hypothetical protein